MDADYARFVETERLLLRPFTARDLSDWHRSVFADPDVMRFLPAQAPVPRERTAALLKAFVRHWDDHGFGPWAVTLRSDGRLLGHCGLRYLPESIQVELMYAIEKRSWGVGYATEAGRASLRFGFEEAGLGKIVALAMPENGASRRVMVKLGMAEEGTAKLFGVDLVRYGILPERFNHENARYVLLTQRPAAPDSAPAAPTSNVRSEARGPRAPGPSTAGATRAASSPLRFRPRRAWP